MFEHSGLQFHRVAPSGPTGATLGFWGSLRGWCVELVQCGLRNRHDWDDWPACRRCGISGRAQYTRINDLPADYVSLRIRHDGTCTARRVQGGDVIIERELDSVPKQWPT